MVLSIYDRYKTDDTLEADGAWVDFGDGIFIRVRSSACKAAREWIRGRFKKQRGIMMGSQGALPIDLIDKNDIDFAAEVIVSGWKGVTTPNGAGGEKEVEFSTENVRHFMRVLPRLRQDILLAAQTAETFRAEEQEALGKTSATPSAPASPSGDTPST